MKKALFLAVGAALASPAFAQSSVQLYGIVDLAYRHTTNEGTAGPASSLTGDRCQSGQAGGLSLFETAEFGHIDKQRHSGDG